MRREPTKANATPKPEKPSKQPKRARQQARVLSAVIEVARVLWPPDGIPPKMMPTNKALYDLGDALDERGIKASPATQKRAIERAR